MSYEQSKVAFVDIETTGLDPELDFVWEIAVIRDAEEYVWQQRLPEFDGMPDWSRVSKWVLDNTRILDTYDHEAALEPEHSIVNLTRLVRGRHIVGACPWFDSERLHRVWLSVDPPRRDLPWHYHLIDVENLAVGYLRARAEFNGWVYIPPEIGASEAEAIKVDRTTKGRPWALVSRTDPPVWEVLPWKSEDLSLALGVDPADFEPKHSALAGARWAKAIYEKIMGPPR